ncbi:hypothetical protein DFH07DRAFT_794176 [Mycena maculata]|uniref:2'-phosphotransferase n=1 Tax=Mycena maculata TaxID=230809 RepID=A0AAD7NYH6_9AGAR|nr:hypothetical protein DFH07DRAFT_794176 [Mycena maculata]
MSLHRGLSRLGYSGYRFLSSGTRTNARESPSHFAGDATRSHPHFGLASSRHLAWEDAGPSEYGAPSYVAEQEDNLYPDGRENTPHLDGQEVPPQESSHTAAQESPSSPAEQETVPHLPRNGTYLDGRALTTPRPSPEVKQRWKFPPTRMTRFTTQLNWVLRHGAMEMGVTIRPDGFARLSDIKECQRFRQYHHVTSEEFDLLLQQEGGRRFKLIRDFDVRTGTDSLWIRSIRGHSSKGLDPTVRRIKSLADLPVAVYPLYLQEWSYVERYGIRPSGDGFIHLIKTTLNENFAHATGSSFDVLIFLDVPKMLSLGIQIFVNPKGEVLTNGDGHKRLPPPLFERVVRVRVEKETLLESEPYSEYERWSAGMASTKKL